MMGSNEQQALQVVSHYEEVVSEQTRENHGQLINFYGDGSLSVFNHVDDALHCATEIQKDFNSDMTIPLRIGVHCGEVIFQNKNVYGDCVNIASRIESLGQAGSVLLSEGIHYKLQDSTHFTTELLGSYEFKNVKTPMNIFALSSGGLRVPDRTTITGKLKTTKTENQELSIAVMPFENHAQNSEQSFLIDGVADEIRSQLLSIEGINVISRSSCMAYKDKSYTLEQLKEELQVNYVLEGRVQLVNERIRLQIDLSSTKTNRQVWSSAPLDRSIEQLFELQSEVALFVAKELRLMLSEGEKQKISKVATTNMDAINAYQKGMDLIHQGHGKVQELNDAILCFEEAIQHDPNFTKAYIGLTDTYWEFLFWGRAKMSEIIEPAKAAADKAMELDPSSGESLGTMGVFHLYQHNDAKLAKEYLLKAVEQSPSYLMAYEKLGWMAIGAKNFDQAEKMFHKAQELDPLSSKYRGDLGHAYYYTGRYDEGIAYLKGHLEHSPKDPWLLWMYAYLLSGAGRFEEAIETLGKRVTSGQRSNWMLGYCYGMLGKKEEAQAILDFHLNKNKLDYVPPYMIATICIGLEDKEAALYWLEQAKEEGGQGLFSIGLNSDPKFTSLHGHPRFEALI
jgi:TolB-like protein